VLGTGALEICCKNLFIKILVQHIFIANANDKIFRQYSYMLIVVFIFFNAAVKNFW